MQKLQHLWGRPSSPGSAGAPCWGHDPRDAFSQPRCLHAHTHPPLLYTAIKQTLLTSAPLLPTALRLLHFTVSLSPRVLPAQLHSMLGGTLCTRSLSPLYPPAHSQAVEGNMAMGHSCPQPRRDTKHGDRVLQHFCSWLQLPQGPHPSAWVQARGQGNPPHPSPPSSRDASLRIGAICTPQMALGPF